MFTGILLKNGSFVKQVWEMLSLVLKNLSEFWVC